jgi:thiol-disulfide isomerase/thioredoxin
MKYYEKMCIKYVFIFCVAISLINKANSQLIERNDQFILNGEIIGKDTGSVILWHVDKNNKAVADTVKLNKGKFRFLGTVNRACEALLWTDLRNRDFDDPSVIRFLLEPGTIYISHNVKDAVNSIIIGSESQSEKDSWDRAKLTLLNSNNQYYETIKSLAKLYKTDKTPELEDQINQVAGKIDSINEIIKGSDLKYIREHLNSYLSGYLLSKHTRKLSVDSIQMLYNKLAQPVKNSSLGHLVLEYVYPLTDDNEFRKANPLIGTEFDQRLRKINSIYDLDLRDTAGNIVVLSSFKGKYLVLDFWASWCKPCIENIPAVNQMVKYYKSDSIQFISISLDYDIHAWKQAIIKHHFTGIQLSDSTGFNSLVAIYCKVLWVPTYIIAGQNGRIIKYNAPQAIEPELKTLLDNLLKQKFQKPKIAD